MRASLAMPFAFSRGLIAMQEFNQLLLKLFDGRIIFFDFLLLDILVEKAHSQEKSNLSS